MTGRSTLIVILVGTDHTFQTPPNNAHLPANEAFRLAIRHICLQHKVKAIAEEMNQMALEERRTTQSVPQQLSAELNLHHLFAEPNRDERRLLGINPEEINKIKAQGWKNGWTQKQIDAVDNESDRIREREWLRRIQNLNTWPLLFICGADHFTSFAILLRKAGMTVLEAFQDWAPDKQI
jgi:hypothetical protein